MSSWETNKTMNKRSELGLLGKMKRHRTHEHNLLSERMCDEFNDTRNMRDLALVTHLYIEYFVNELIIAKFQSPELVIDDNELGSFKNKILLLKSMGLFEGTPHVIRNIELIQRVRNHYAHNLLLTDEVPEPVASRVTQLVYFDWDGELCDYDVPWSEHAEPLYAQLHVCALQTTNALIRLRECKT